MGQNVRFRPKADIRQTCRMTPFNKLVGAVLAVIGSTALAQSNVWTPKVEFSLEGASYSETLAWVSGWSYALTEAGRNRSGICLPKNGTVDSKTVLDVLNATFKGQKVTAEQVAPVLFAEARAKYRCLR